MFLSKVGPRWSLDLSDYELDLIIRSMDEEPNLSDRDNDDLDKMQRVLFGIRKGLTVKTHRGFCAVCKTQLKPHESHDHPRGTPPPR